MVTRKKMIYGIIFISLATCMVILSNYSFNTGFDEDFKIFNSSRLAGKITYITGSKEGDRFRLENSDIRFHCVSELSPNNKFLTFSQSSEIGDSVYKPAFSDTLFLIKAGNGEVYRFTFAKTH